jgi:hypothetical protein
MPAAWILPQARRLELQYSERGDIGNYRIRKWEGVGEVKSEKSRIQGYMDTGIQEFQENALRAEGG